MKNPAILEIVNTIERSKIIPVFYHDDAQICLSVLKVCHQVGLTIFEFTNRGENALANFNVLQNYNVQQNYIASSAPEVKLGIGTIFNAVDANEFLENNAKFVVSPAMIPAMHEIQSKGLAPWIPGCSTISEIVEATTLGAKLIKIFPANVLGPEFAKAAQSVLPEIKLMPTGGIDSTRENLAAWFKSGVVAVGMGSQLFSKDLLEKKDWNGLEKKVKDALRIINELKP